MCSSDLATRTPRCLPGRHAPWRTPRPDTMHSAGRHAPWRTPRSGRHALCWTPRIRNTAASVAPRDLGSHGVLGVSFSEGFGSFIFGGVSISGQTVGGWQVSRSVDLHVSRVSFEPGFCRFRGFPEEFQDRPHFPSYLPPFPPRPALLGRLASPRPPSPRPLARSSSRTRSRPRPPPTTYAPRLGGGAPPAGLCVGSGRAAAGALPCDFFGASSVAFALSL